MSTTSTAIYSNPLFATYSVYARNASIAEVVCASQHHAKAVPYLPRLAYNHICKVGERNHWSGSSIQQRETLPLRVPSTPRLQQQIKFTVRVKATWTHAHHQEWWCVSLAITERLTAAVSATTRYRWLWKSSGSSKTSTWHTSKDHGSESRPLGSRSITHAGGQQEWGTKHPGWSRDKIDTANTYRSTWMRQKTHQEVGISWYIFGRSRHLETSRWKPGWPMMWLSKLERWSPSRWHWRMFVNWSRLRHIDDTQSSRIRKFI